MGFFDTDFGSPIPWLADVEPDTWCTFSIDMVSLVPVENEVPFEMKGGKKTITEALADMKQISDHNGREIAKDGQHTIPFWACSSLQAALVSEAKGNRKWVDLRYRRTVVMKKGAENSRAEFVVED